MFPEWSARVRSEGAYRPCMEGGAGSIIGRAVRYGAASAIRTAEILNSAAK